MKANELMIGDWVYTPFMTLMSQPERKACKVTAELLGNDKALKEISPIPITKEILKVNGFKLFDDDNLEDCTLYTLNDESIMYDLSNGAVQVGDGIRNFFIIYYVHELQNVLRISDYASIADNFKVK